MTNNSEVSIGVKKPQETSRSLEKPQEAQQMHKVQLKQQVQGKQQATKMHDPRPCRFAQK